MAADTLVRTRNLFARMKRTSDPANLPVTVENAKDQLQIEHDDDDTLIQRYIEVATAKVENDTRRGLITQTWAQYLDDFPDDELIVLRRNPVSSVSSVQYTDTDGDTQTFSSAKYQTDTNNEPARLFPAYNEEWPDVRVDTLNGVVITFIVGYGANHTSVPKDAQQAVLWLVHHYWAVRCPVADMRFMPVPLGYDSLIEQLAWDW